MKLKKYRIKQIKTVDGNGKNEDIFFIQRRFLFFWVRASFNHMGYNDGLYADWCKETINFNTYAQAKRYLELQQNIIGSNSVLNEMGIKVITAYTYEYRRCYMILGQSKIVGSSTFVYYFTFDHQEALKQANKLIKTKQTKIHNV